ncbi:MAG: thiamine diphosphokinase [Armatimonadota bacterium]
MKALILCNGQPPSYELLARHLRGAELILCTDGASRWVQELGVTPNVLIGDMDSGALTADCEVIDCGPHDRQEDTDAEKALRLALDRGATEIVMLGATGLRLDHTLGNVWLAARYHEQAEIVVADAYGELRVVTGRYALQTRPGARVSLLALTADVTLDTEGLKWPLHGPLEPGTRGLSNEAVAEEVVVDVRTGMVAVMTA